MKIKTEYYFEEFWSERLKNGDMVSRPLYHASFNENELREYHSEATAEAGRYWQHVYSNQVWERKYVEMDEGYWENEDLKLSEIQRFERLFASVYEISPLVRTFNDVVSEITEQEESYDPEWLYFYYEPYLDKPYVYAGHQHISRVYKWLEEEVKVKVWDIEGLLYKINIHDFSVCEVEIHIEARNVSIRKEKANAN
jgi:hypothetical protein